MSDREQILDRIRKLRERTSARGCTEAEALAAAAKVAEWMRDHGITDGDVEFMELRVNVKSNAGRWPALWTVVGLCVSSAVTLGRDRHGAYVRFTGRPAGVEVAAYLVEVCERAIEREAVLFKAGTFYRRRRSVATKRAAMADFRSGIIDRIGVRLLKLFRDVVDGGTEEREAARSERNRRNPDTSSVSLPAHQERYAQATDAGYAAGARPTLTHGVGGSSSTPKLIGRA